MKHDSQDVDDSMTNLNKKEHITLTYLKELKKELPKPKLYRIRDTALNGFVIRVQPSGSMTYYFEYRDLSGANQSYKIGRIGSLSLAQAREKAENLSAEVQLGVDVQAAKKKKHDDAKANKNNTLSGFLDETYEKWANTHLVDGKSEVKRIKRNFSELLDLPLSEISPSYIVSWRTEELDNGKSASTINRDVTCLYSALSKAVSPWKIISIHPLLELKPLKIDELSTPRYLSVDEEKMLYEALNTREGILRAKRASANKWRTERHLPPYQEIGSDHYVDHLKPMVVLSLHTGIRRGELFKLSWDDIYFETSTLTVKGPNAKSKKTRHIPLNSSAETTLKKWKEQLGVASGLVFPNKDGETFDNISTSWGNLLDTAKIVKFRWHDIRHTFASKLVMAGVPLNTVRELMGHSDIKMTLR